MFPYTWGRYDLLVLPSSFPYGGMEVGDVGLIALKHLYTYIDSHSLIRTHKHSLIPKLLFNRRNYGLYL